MIGSSDIFLIADIGKNFIQAADDRPVSEYLENAKKLVDAAVDSGVDAVKFQTHVAEDEQLDTPVEAPHFRGHDRYAWVKRNELATPLSFWKALKEYCDAKGVIFFSTPMSRKAAQKLMQVDVPLWKVASGDVLDHLLLEYLVSTGKPIIISTGMVSLAELDDVMAYLRPAKAPLALLYCVSKYPCPPEFFNLATIKVFQKKYPDVVVGFSDHSIGHEVALAAVRAGARVVEKHFSFSRDLWGPDHKASMTPPEMRAFVKAVRQKAYESVDISPYEGMPEKELEGAGSEFRGYFHKALVAAGSFSAGTVITGEKLYAMRPLALAGGLPSQAYETVIGRKFTRDVRQYEPITPDLLS